MRICIEARLLVLGVSLAFAPGATATPQQSDPSSSAQSAAHATAYQFDVDATKQWIDTKLDFRQGEKLRFTATGTITYPADNKHPDGRTFGPTGLARGFEDLIHEYAVP